MRSAPVVYLYPTPDDAYVFKYRRSKKLEDIDASYQDFIELVFCSNNYQFKGITPEIAELSTSLPEEVNQDPADRIISATSIIYKIPLVTTDYNLLNADSIETIW